MVEKYAHTFIWHKYIYLAYTQKVCAYIWHTCIHGIHLAYIWYTFGIHLAYIECARKLCAYIWHTFGIHLIFWRDCVRALFLRKQIGLAGWFELEYFLYHKLVSPCLPSWRGNSWGWTRRVVPIGHSPNTYCWLWNIICKIFWSQHFVFMVK